MGYTSVKLVVLTTSDFDRWFTRLRDRQARAHISARLTRVAQGNLGGAKSVRARVSELRIDHGPGYRLYFTRRGAEFIVLLVGGDKSTQQRDIELAIELAARLKR
jgi:putative addiction module killer protein